MNVVLAVVVLYASIDALARRRPRRRSMVDPGELAAPRRWLRLTLRAIGSTAVAAAGLLVGAGGLLLIGTRRRRTSVRC